MTPRFARQSALFLSALAAVPEALAEKNLDNAQAPRICAGDPLRREIPGFTIAQNIDRPKPRYPNAAQDSWSEGWVLLQNTIAADGSVQDISVVDAIGSKEFVDASVRALAKWRYKPATRNNVPVEQTLSQVSVMYLFEDSGRAATHRKFIREYDVAREQIQQRKFDEAIATLEAAFNARLNHYEQAMGSFLLGVSYANKNDRPRALFHMRHAVIEDGDYLENLSRPRAFALLVELEARNGNLNESLCAFEDLRKIDAAAAGPESAAAKMAARINETLTAPGPIAIEAQLAKHPLVDAPAVWRHQLLRSKFSFDQIKGDVKSFRLTCVGTTHEALVEADMRWDVPTKAGACILRVDGASGATFRLIEE